MICRMSKRHSGKAAARSATRRRMSVTFADGRESVNGSVFEEEAAAYFFPHAGLLKDARTRLEDLFNILY